MTTANLNIFAPKMSDRESLIFFPKIQMHRMDLDYICSKMLIEEKKRAISSFSILFLFYFHL